MLTGGCLKLATTDGKMKLKNKLKSKIRDHVMKDFPNVKIICPDEPQFGSIMNGAKTLFSLQDFD